MSLRCAKQTLLEWLQEHQHADSFKSFNGAFAASMKSMTDTRKALSDAAAVLPDYMPLNVAGALEHLAALHQARLEVKMLLEKRWGLFPAEAREVLVGVYLQNEHL